MAQKLEEAVGRARRAEDELRRTRSELQGAQAAAGSKHQNNTHTQMFRGDKGKGMNDDATSY